jgi:hypothetical protein
MAWIDGPTPRKGELAAWAAKVAQVCDVAAIFTPREGALHLCRWDEGLLVDALRALQAQGLQTRITVWATSNPAKWAEQEAWLGRVLEMCAVGGVERPWLDLDAESSWRGVQTLASIEAFAARWKLRVSANYVPSLRLSGHITVLLTAPWVDELIPQAYSQWNPSATWTHDKLIRPRTFQRHAIGQLEVIQAKRAQDASVRCGLMAAFQQHPAPHPQGLDALDAALDEARKLGVPEVALWSYKHLVNPKRPDVTRWASGLKGGAGVG